MSGVDDKRAAWKVQPAAETLVREQLEAALERTPSARAFAQALLSGCAVRLRDLLDHISFSDPLLVKDLRTLGWQDLGQGIWRNDSGLFPDFVEDNGATQIAFRCETLEVFQRAWKTNAPIEGAPFAPLRRLKAFEGEATVFIALERNGFDGVQVLETKPTALRAAQLHLQSFRARRRQFDQPEQGLNHTETLVDRAVTDLGAHWACDLFFRAEREYWMARSDAGRWQKARQDSVGIGWGNIDHHTYDSSREHFAQTIRILEKLGYRCRELFYAGHQAGWGSQVLEQPVLRSTIFADIDLTPEELGIDFAHLPLAPLAKHRRAGLWCALHGESMLEAGLNHLAGYYCHRSLQSQLAAVGFTTMAPFSDFPHLYQALTEGQWQAVAPDRVDSLEAGGHLSAAEAESFRLKGAISTHLENLERNDGFKGFNQPGIDGVLRIIDPRQNQAAQ